MSLDSDVIIDRRRLRKKVSFWRILFFIVAIIALASLALDKAGIENSRRGAHIARIEVFGVISQDKYKLRLLKKLATDNNVKAVIVAINSPGGTTTGGERLYYALRDIAKRKPVVASIGTVGASAGYMTALGADHIVANYNSITGSIGVLFQYSNFEGLLDKVGVKFDAVKSAPLKAEPNFYSEPTQEVKDVIHSLINDSYQWFVGLVAERRAMDKSQALSVANGQVYSGHQALELGLVDEIGGEEAARAWVIAKLKLDDSIKVIDWYPESPEKDFPFYAKIASHFGFTSDFLLGDLLQTLKNYAESSLPLDGLVSVWQAPQVADHSVDKGGTND
ncbi:signal peptide peptidase SppA [Polycladidibacter stylochi]|uniref:signal peptide peptidase SppA n=1 Tax=Polycladidibacter stylochi TaxID=1807766 RepID=UPI0008374739|nr:signal peptide peptidase SppA [Pseudovibrio stylochi]